MRVLGLEGRADSASRSIVPSNTSKVLWFHQGVGMPCSPKYTYMIQLRQLKQDMQEHLHSM